MKPEAILKVQKAMIPVMIIILRPRPLVQPVLQGCLTWSRLHGLRGIPMNNRAISLPDLAAEKNLGTVKGPKGEGRVRFQGPVVMAPPRKRNTAASLSEGFAGSNHQGVAFDHHLNHHEPPLGATP